MPGTLLLETIRAGDCGRPRRVVAQTRGRPRQVLLHIFTWNVDLDDVHACFSRALHCITEPLSMTSHTIEN